MNNADIEIPVLKGWKLLPDIRRPKGYLPTAEKTAVFTFPRLLLAITQLAEHLLLEFCPGGGLI